MIYYKPLSKHPDEVKFYQTYFDTPAESCDREHYSPTAEHETDIYVITFNHLFLAEYQIKMFRRFFRTPYNLILVDNNNWLHPEQSRQLRQLCLAESVTYLKAPDNYHQRPGSFDPSMKLGTTMNWLYVQCVLARRPRYFGFIDHDSFLIRDLFDMPERLEKQGMWGRTYRSKIKPAAWTLHAGIDFFRLSFVEPYPLDFRPSHIYQIDTGGANYDVLFRHLNYDDYQVRLDHIRYDREDVNRPGSVQHYELVGGAEWYHMCASSHDQLAGDGAYKLAYTKGFLDSRLYL